MFSYHYYLLYEDMNKLLGQLKEVNLICNPYVRILLPVHFAVSLCNEGPV